MKIQLVLKKSENVSLLEKECQYFIPLKRFIFYLSGIINVISLIPSHPISIKLDIRSVFVFLLETNEFSKKKHCSALRIEKLIVKIC